MGRPNYVTRQYILVKQGKITPEIAQARIEQHRQMRRLKKKAAKDAGSGK